MKNNYILAVAASLFFAFSAFAEDLQQPTPDETETHQAAEDMNQDATKTQTEMMKDKTHNNKGHLPVK
ncbi:MAG: hypothetical protein SFT91_01235 [Rickettsiaceae bacterium]|nr:hypothetical protein [Rickettsiaceae bacterium]